MNLNVITIIIGALALVAGIVASKLIFAKNTCKEADLQAHALIKETLSKAETLKDFETTTNLYLKEIDKWIAKKSNPERFNPINRRQKLPRSKGRK